MLPPHKFSRPSCCYWLLQEIIKYGIVLAFNGITFIPSFVKIAHLIKKYNSGMQTQTLFHALWSIFHTPLCRKWNQSRYREINLWKRPLKCAFNVRSVDRYLLFVSILWRVCCRQCGVCWQPLLGKQHLTYFLCGLTPACTQQSKELLFFLWSVPEATMGWCDRKCFLCGQCQQSWNISLNYICK
jgi:hypothetical protein